ncbi:hypothetical protein D2E25_1125 [Bifidobacterium goeldii]|uniref:Uncharacterized protein n=1 Tax=Bifidobacterium goeldii TaxID=2306975 RepID=A0A430FK69_9BIFI|nr:hypothetical protein D2E25_1125 [Bifidobacterium goeldii]
MNHCKLVRGGNAMRVCHEVSFNAYAYCIYSNKE